MSKRNQQLGKAMMRFEIETKTKNASYTMQSLHLLIEAINHWRLLIMTCPFCKMKSILRHEHNGGMSKDHHLSKKDVVEECEQKNHMMVINLYHYQHQDSYPLTYPTL